MSKLYPPYVESKIPAMAYDLSTNESLILRVPFQLNKAVGRAEFNKVSIIIKTVSTGTIKDDGITTSDIIYDTNTRAYYALFVLDKTKYDIGQYYKVQIAFISIDNIIGYYSSVAIVKCTSKPDVVIDGLTQSQNLSQYSYTGIYKQTNLLINDVTQSRDASEKVYSYCFTIYDFETGEVFDTSGIQLHNASYDTEKDQSSDTWTSMKTLLTDHVYQIQYQVITLNNMTAASGRYNIMVTDTVDLSLNTELRATLYEEDAYINLHLTPIKHDQKLLSGNFVLVRASNKDNFENWVEVYRFNMVNNYPEAHLWDDYTIQQGYQYKYAIQAYNDAGLYSNRLEATYFLCEQDEDNYVTTNNLIVEFEDAYLFDGERQLRIRYNPKVSSFKSTILESKMDTLGGKYPFIFRNGNVEYKEFPISGLISATMDINGKFLPAAKGVDKVRTKTAAGAETIDVLDTSLSRDNFRKEREFKLEVLSWLTNGKPKLFRSPGEGNYIVRTMNASMTPNDTLSRMLHTFNCTAYEIAEYNFDNLKKYGFMNSSDLAYKEMKFNMLKLNTILTETKGSSYSLSEFGGAFYLHFDNQWTNLVLELTFLDGKTASYNIANATGHYALPEIGNNPVIKISYSSGTIDAGSNVMFGYYNTDVESVFSDIHNITLEDIACQFMDIEGNIIDEIEDIRLKTGRFYLIKVVPRKIISIAQNSNNQWVYAGSSQVIDNWDSSALYYHEDRKRYYSGEPSGIGFSKVSYLFQLNSGYNSDLARGVEDPYTSGRFESIVDIEKVDYLSIGNGLICDVVYHLKTYEYNVEVAPWNESYPQLMSAKQTWINNPNDQTYNIYLNYLKQAIDAERGDTLNAI